MSVDVEAILKAAGSSLDRVVKAQIEFVNEGRDGPWLP